MNGAAAGCRRVSVENIAEDEWIQFVAAAVGKLPRKTPHTEGVRHRKLFVQRKNVDLPDVPAQSKC